MQSEKLIKKMYVITKGHDATVRKHKKSLSKKGKKVSESEVVRRAINDFNPTPYGNKE